MGRCRHDEHRVTAAVARGLEEERDVEDGDGGAFRDRPGEEGPLFLADEGVDDRLEPPEALRVSQHRRCELRPVDDAIAHGPRESLFDEPCR